MMACQVVLLCLWTVLYASRTTTGLVPLSAPRCSQSGVFGASFRRRPQLSASTSGGSHDSHDLTNPENWYASTPPHGLLEAIAAPGVSMRVILSFLREQKIRTLKDLTDYYYELIMADIIDKQYANLVFDHLMSASTRIKLTIEQLLGGKAVYDKVYLPETAFKKYALAAVSVIPDTKEARDAGVREKPFTLVLGSSGSGKTMFALKRLPTLLFGDSDVDNTDYFCVHFTANKVSDQQKTQKLATFAEALVSLVKEEIADQFKITKFASVDVIDLYLHVIIDEAGADFYRNVFDTASKIQTFVASLESFVVPKFQRGVHVTLVGTGLDEITQQIPSGAETIKFRTQPWTFENFKALLLQCSHSRPNLVLETVQKYPVLEDLITNGRCAFLILTTMRNTFDLRADRVKDVVKVLIRKVIDGYIDSNGLSKLETPEKQFLVARSVLRAIDNSTSQPGVAFFPRFDDISYIVHPSIPNSLFDVHVDSLDGKLSLVSGELFALSLSPAVALVIAGLFNLNAGISWDWNRFESVVMLSELKHLVVNSVNVPRRVDRLVLQLKSPLPGSRATNTFTLPMAGNATVILNGPRAGFADVIAPYRLVQAKNSVDDSKTIDLNIQTELDKMGLTDKLEFKQFLTDMLYSKIWNSDEDAPEPKVIKWTSTKRDHRHACYPFDALNGRRIVEHPSVMIGVLKPADKDVDRCFFFNGVRLDRDSPLNFTDELPVAAVFVTNCNAFRLEKGHKAEGEDSATSDVDDLLEEEVELSLEMDVIDERYTEGSSSTGDSKTGSEAVALVKPQELIIHPQDVDWNGNLLDPNKIPMDFISGLRQNVKIRFLFFGSH